MRNSKGFTLVELAIVLMIIGVILGGVVKGTELVKNAKIKRLYRDYQNVQTAMLSYLDRTGAIAGDTTTAGVVADNLITDNDTFWNALRDANLYDTSGEDDTDPAHVFGGTMQVSSAILGFTGNVLCFENIETENATTGAAASIDKLFDDGDATSGNIRAVADAATIPTATAAPTGAYSTLVAGKLAWVCISLD